MDTLQKIYSIASEVRQAICKKYNGYVAGHCIEASDLIVQAITDQLGIPCNTVEGWCRYDDESYGSDRPWDEHTWVEIPSMGLYVDVTADQFNYGMREKNEFPEIIIQKGLPYGMQYDEPTWETYDYEMSSMEDTIPSDMVHPTLSTILEKAKNQAISRQSASFPLTLDTPHR